MPEQKIHNVEKDLVGNQHLDIGRNYLCFQNAEIPVNFQTIRHTK